MKCIFPMQYLNITQGYGVGTHIGTYAVDNAGKDTGIDNAFAPFTGIVKRIYTKSSNVVWLESTEPVDFPDGYHGIATVMFVHDNSVADLHVGQVVSQGTVFYQEGTSGNATGNHVHIEIAKGPFTGNGWYKNSAGWWTINNGVKPDKSFYITDSTIIKNTGGYTWIKEDDVITNNDVAPVRVVMSECEGWDHDQIHSGADDGIIMSAWVGHSWPEFIMHTWDVQKTKRGDLLNQINNLTSQITNLDKRPTQEQLDALNASVADLQGKLAVSEKAVADSKAAISKETVDQIAETNTIVKSIKGMLVNFIGWVKGKLGR